MLASKARLGWGWSARNRAIAGLGASWNLVAIAAGVDMEYRCQPSSMCPAMRTSTLPPGGAAGGSTLSFQVTCWSPWATCATRPRARRRSPKIAGFMRKSGPVAILPGRHPLFDVRAGAKLPMISPLSWSGAHPCRRSSKNAGRNTGMAGGTPALPEHANLGGHVLQDIAQKWGAVLQQVVLRHVVVRQVRPDSGVLDQVGIRVIAVEVFFLSGLQRQRHTGDAFRIGAGIEIG